MMFRQYIAGIIFILLAVPSSSQQFTYVKDLTPQKIAAFVEQAESDLNPDTVAYKLIKQTPERLSNDQVLTLRRSGYHFFAFEWAIRLIDQGQHQQALLLLERHWYSAPRSSHIRLLELLRQQQQFYYMNRVLKRFGEIEPYSTLNAMDKSKSIDEIDIDSAGSLGFSIFGRNEQSIPCEHKVVLLAESLRSVKQLAFLKAKYMDSSFSIELPYCFSEPYYVGDLTQCRGKGAEFIRCDIHHLIEQPVTKQARHLVIMTDKPGLANVRHGVMALNSKSGFELFIHELMHFTYFEDEYPVSANRAKWLCATEGLKAPNLYVGENAPKGWYQSETCKFGKLPSYKPQRAVSKMEYHEIHLSNQYLGLWLKSLDKTLLAPSDYQNYLNALSVNE
ncbi:hypothetical protein [Pseudoalteromonas luteoviolacea]|uniref:hypothetical protein n=1 Tax=Pseudoalteromonas luteoviolacea TaxID=43657 RepID=UPI001B35DBF4|nr:hypothetical protein [Pseudoalteromonas luteoviolacea]MBQ4838902.1 hypothetical protein [Pseudoalteromonas luteoviolacea]